MLLKVHHKGNLVLWEHFTEVIDDLPADGPTRDETLVSLWTRGSVWLDESIERITEIYYEVQAQALETRIGEDGDHPGAAQGLSPWIPVGRSRSFPQPLADRVRGWVKPGRPSRPV